MVTRRRLLIGGGAAAVLGAIGGGVAAEWDSPRFVQLRGGCGDNPPIPHASYNILHGVFDSQAMRAKMPWTVAVPSDGLNDGPLIQVPSAIVLCLTGYRDSPSVAVDGIGLPGFATAAKTSLTFAIPGGGGNLYWHPRADGRNPLSWALDEFLPMVEQRLKVGGGSTRRGIMGWSMGGFGALLAAQQRPTTFGAVAAMSPAVFPSYDAARGGHSYTFDSAADWQRYGLWNHLDDLSGTPVRIDCGNYDPFAPTARQLLKRIPGAVGAIGSGCHDEAFWRRTAPTALRFLSDRLQGAP